jgi:hypothetical protein
MGETRSSTRRQSGHDLRFTRPPPGVIEPRSIGAISLAEERSAAIAVAATPWLWRSRAEALDHRHLRPPLSLEVI